VIAGSLIFFFFFFWSTGRANRVNEELRLPLPGGVFVEAVLPILYSIFFRASK